MTSSLCCILQNKFRRKYEQALSKCWTICIPCTSALRGLDITEDFVGMLSMLPVYNRRLQHKLFKWGIYMIYRDNEEDRFESFHVDIFSSQRSSSIL